MEIGQVTRETDPAGQMMHLDESSGLEELAVKSVVTVRSKGPAVKSVPNPRESLTKTNAE
jgi:hypothetical protein